MSLADDIKFIRELGYQDRSTKPYDLIIPGGAEQVWCVLEECEALQSRLDVAVKALEWYAANSGDWERADQALAQIRGKNLCERIDG